MEIIAYHISEFNFKKFDNSHIGNFATILDAFYFLSSKNEIQIFKDKGFIYTVKLTPKKLFEFDLNNEGWTTLDFQQKFTEQLAGLDNELSNYIENINEIDCIALTNLEYLTNQKIIEFVVLDKNIITILNKQII
jgi:hypothetical protein